jgi:hypothetical protein
MAQSSQKGGIVINKVEKYACVKGLEITDGELDKINALAIKELSADDVFIFKVAMCDNEIDRDFEYFPADTLAQMAELFKGKTVISDHKRTASNQVARIYDTELVKTGEYSLSGENYTQLVAKCYMLKSEATADLIAAIEAGITKEVSVSCAIKSAVCSICGTDNRETYCKHWNGETYDGNVCYFALKGALDAYELSFVAVPAQPKAGVTKAYGEEPIDYKAEPPDSEKPNTETEALTLSIDNVGAFLFAKKSKIKLEEDING